jgi:hypothetical protein
MQTKISSTAARTRVVTRIPALLIRMQAAFFVILLLTVVGPFGAGAQCTINTCNTISGFTPAGPDRYYNKNYKPYLNFAMPNRTAAGWDTPALIMQPIGGSR